MKNILVGIDFDEKTEDLIEKAQDVAKKFDAKLWLLHAVAPLAEYGGVEVTPYYTSQEQASLLKNEHSVLDGYTKDLEAKGFEAEGVVMEGATIEVILEESEKLKVDLIICGHHDHNFLYNIFFGSISATIVRRSNIPVLVFPLG